MFKTDVDAYSVIKLQDLHQHKHCVAGPLAGKTDCQITGEADNV